MLISERYIRKILLDDKSFLDVLIKSFQSVGMRLAGLVINFVISVLLAKNLGADGLGLYALITTVLLLSSVAGRVGLDNVVIREVSRALSIKDKGSIIGVLKKSFLICFFSSGFISIVIYSFGNYFGEGLYNKDIFNGIVAIAVFVLPFSLLVLIINVLKGYELAWQAVFLENTGFNFFRLLGVVFILLWGKLTVYDLYFIHGLSIVVCFCIGLFFLLKLIDWREREEPYSYKKIFSSSIPLFWVASIDLVNAQMDTVMLGVISNTAQVGYYDVAYRVSMLIGFVLVSLNSILGPKFASLYRQGKLMAMQSLACKGTVISLIFSLPLVVLFILFPNVILSLWGEEFVKGEVTLIVLSVGQLFNVLVGSVGCILSMTMNERSLRSSVFIVLVINFTLNMILIPIYGALGAAISTAVAVALQNIFLLYMVKIKLNITTTPLTKCLARV